ncbi:DUF1257 domain-containing protein [Synechococcus sp. RSCCF101]|uniref:DUF1257 domain-containing protein n=1 Tax=Synechococcus sp. RSCCF101 TaxID=2511069 RepID=UPI001243D612|nr:DUF1257 domain-containing protein [Synechococcus sp. RSCCF101]QEY31708.1 DUF1257 domain-containing protein [Synechococcus sp. RSCCF101]
MSHLSILPTVLRDADILKLALTDLGLTPLPAHTLHGFGDQTVPVVLAVQLPGGPCIGWRRCSDGHLEVVADLARLAVHSRLERLLSDLGRRYALREAMGRALSDLPEARVDWGELPATPVSTSP